MSVRCHYFIQICWRQRNCGPKTRSQFFLFYFLVISFDTDCFFIFIFHPPMDNIKFFSAFRYCTKIVRYQKFCKALICVYLGTQEKRNSYVHLQLLTIVATEIIDNF